MAEVAVRKFLISGRVQGVYFRASTRHKAQELAIKGYARNLDDGRVEVLAVGAPDALETLGHWLRRGPPAARVDDVATEVLALHHLPFELQDFETT